jgi:amino acid transporter
MIIVLSNLAGVAVSFFYLMLGEVFGSQTIATLADNVLVNILTCLAFIAMAMAISYRGMTTTKEVQNALVGLQMAVLALFIVLAFTKVIGGVSDLAIDFSLSWLNPLAAGSFAAFTAGISLSIFIYWGWDVCLTVNEETTDSDKTPGRAALLTVLTIVSTYLLVAIASQMFAGIGEQGIGLGNPDTADNVFAALAGPVLGGLAILLFLAVLISSAASLQATFVAVTRTMLAMGFYRAAPERLAHVHPRYQVPLFATLFAGVGTSCSRASSRASAASC